MWGWYVACFNKRSKLRNDKCENSIENEIGAALSKSFCNFSTRNLLRIRQQMSIYVVDAVFGNC